MKYVPNMELYSLTDRASLNKLKHHIADEGCPQMQYDLAKELLNNAIGECRSLEISKI